MALFVLEVIGGNAVFSHFVEVGALFFVVVVLFLFEIVLWGKKAKKNVAHDDGGSKERNFGVHDNADFHYFDLDLFVFVCDRGKKNARRLVHHGGGFFRHYDFFPRCADDGFDFYLDDGLKNTFLEN